MNRLNKGFSLNSLDKKTLASKRNLINNFVHPERSMKTYFDSLARQSFNSNSEMLLKKLSSIRFNDRALVIKLGSYRPSSSIFIKTIGSMSRPLMPVKFRTQNSQKSIPLPAVPKKNYLRKSKKSSLSEFTKKKVVKPPENLEKYTQISRWDID